MISIALALCVAAAAPSKSPLAEANRDIAAGEFERALKKIDAALKKSTDPRELAGLQLARGQALLAIGNADKALGAFIAAVKKDPTLDLDASRASPDAVRLLEKARASVPATISVKLK